MRQITDFILSSFQNSGKKHLIFTGSKGSGKTTFVEEIVENFSNKGFLPGITTYLIPGEGVKLRENGTQNEVYIGKMNEVSMIPVEEGFVGLGTKALAIACESASEWASVDEIGFLESGNQIFQEAVRNLFEKKRVLAVVRKQDLPFLNELRDRDDVYLVDLDEHPKKIGCVVMASGLGVRFGRNKLLEKFQGKTFIQNTLDLTEDIFAKRVVVTRTKEVKELCESQGIPVIFHAYPNRNEAVYLGMKEMMDMDGCLFCPCDQPLLQDSSLKKMRNAFRFEELDIVRLAYEESVGSPILFDKKYFEELLRLPEKKGGGFVAKKYADKVSLVFAKSDKELYDIDTQEDLEFLKGCV